jgi:hypothetical protein
MTTSGVGMNTSIQHWLGLVSILTIAWAVAMAVVAARFEIKARLLSRFESPVAAVELADSPERLRPIFDQGDREHNVRILRYNTYMDCLFILLYCLVFWLFASAYSTSSRIPALVKSAILVAGLFDYAENFQMFREFRDLAQLSRRTVTATRIVSLLKWGFFAAALWFVGVFLWTISTHTLRSAPLSAIAILLLLAAGITSVGLFLNRFLGLMALPLFVALAITSVRFIHL